MSDITKIREEAITIKEKDIDDCNKISERESQKSIAIIGFGVTIILWLLKEADNFSGLVLMLSVLLIMIGILYSVRNLWGDKMEVHTNVETLFTEEMNTLSWEKHIQYKYVHLNKIYYTLNDLCKDKNNRSRSSIILLLIGITLLIINKLTPVIISLISIQ